MENLSDFLNGVGSAIKPVAESVARKATKALTVAGSAAGQSYVRQFFDSGIWDEGMFDDKEQEALKTLVKSKISVGKSGFSYRDYDSEGGKNISYRGGVPDLSDPRKSLKMTLGKGSIVRDANDNIMVVDEYDFDSSRGLEKLPVGERIDALIKAVQDDNISTYGVAHLFAEAFGATAGKGASIRANVGTPEDYGLSAADVQFLPTLEQYNKDNKGRINTPGQIVPKNINEPLPVEQPPAPLPQETITIASGDTLSGLAKKHGTTVDALAKANGIEDVNRINAGQSLKIPQQGE